MNRQLISNQPLREDYGDLEHTDYFQNRDRRVAFEDEDEAEDHKERDDPQRIQGRDYRREHTEPINEAPHSKKTTKRYHQLQVIDEDTEHFKAKLDDLINKFRAETLSEFMSIKRSLLEEQTETIETETRKYSKMLENRTNELDRTKEALAKKQKELERAEVITHVVADWSGRARIKKRNILLLSQCFSAFKLNKERQENKKKAIKLSEALFKKRIVARIFGAWRNIHTSQVEEKTKQDFDSTMNRELGELAAKYNKEIDMLTNRLNEALKSLDEATQNKVDIQENLKKAFMRGVCALNFEAMNILDTKQAGEREEPLTEQQVYSQQIEKIKQGDPNYHSLILNPVDNNTRYTEEREENRESYATSSPKKNIVFYQNPRLESKEMRWREAPVVGTSHASDRKPHKESILKPSSYMGKIENKENETYENQADYHHHYEPMHSAAPAYHEDEGRVIKVTHGKSHSGATSGMGTSVGKQVKGYDKPATVSASSTKTAQLRTQLSKGKK